MDADAAAEFERNVRDVYDQQARIAITPRWVRFYDFGAGRLPGRYRTSSTAISRSVRRIWDSDTAGHTMPQIQDARVNCRISELVLDCADIEKQAAFWSAVLGYVELGREEDEIEIGPPGVGLAARSRRWSSARYGPEAHQAALHIDVNPTDRDQEEELEACCSLGARKVDVGQTGEESWHVLADPEGDEFCLLRRRLDPV